MPYLFCFWGGANEMANSTSIQIRRRPREQRGQRIETNSAFSLRFYATTEDGTRRKCCVKLADKGPQFRCWDDVEPLIKAELAKAEKPAEQARGTTLLDTFVADHYLPWVKENKAAVTENSYRRIWET